MNSNNVTSMFCIKHSRDKLSTQDKMEFLKKSKKEVLSKGYQKISWWSSSNGTKENKIDTFIVQGSRPATKKEIKENLRIDAKIFS